MNDSMQPDGREDERLAALLASVQAEANPAVWARVRTRLAAETAPARSARSTRLDGFFDWLTRPAAMAAATAAVLVALATGWTVLGSLESATTEEALLATDATNLMDSLLETGDGELDGAEAPEAGGADDGAAPGDSGGQS